MSTKNRRPIYLSENKDRDILDYISPKLKKYSFSATIRELVRDGIKYRRSLNNPKSEQNEISNKNIIQSNTFCNNDELRDIELKTIEISNDEIESRLDDF